MTRTLHVLVKPRARQSALQQTQQGWCAQIKAPPVDGKANAELIDLVAQHFQIRKNQVSIKSGAGSRHKLVQIAEGS